MRKPENELLPDNPTPEEIAEAKAISASLYALWLVNKKIGTGGGGGTGEGQPGPAGADAYQVAVNAGFQGTRDQWLDSLIGPAGDDAYEVAVSTGFVGTRQQWVDSLKGSNGQSAKIVSATAKSLPYGSQPTVTLGGTELERTFELGIPEGKPGIDGEDGTGGGTVTEVPASKIKFTTYKATWEASSNRIIDFDKPELKDANLLDITLAGSNNVSIINVPMGREVTIMFTQDSQSSTHEITFGTGWRSTLSPEGGQDFDILNGRYRTVITGVCSEYFWITYFGGMTLDTARLSTNPPQIPPNARVAVLLTGTKTSAFRFDLPKTPMHSSIVVWNRTPYYATSNDLTLTGGSEATSTRNISPWSYRIFDWLGDSWACR